MVDRTAELRGMPGRPLFCPHRSAGQYDLCPVKFVFQFLIEFCSSYIFCRRGERTGPAAGCENSRRCDVTNRLLPSRLR
jgi:hypothetical protein